MGRRGSPNSDSPKAAPGSTSTSHCKTADMGEARRKEVAKRRAHTHTKGYICHCQREAGADGGIAAAGRCTAKESDRFRSQAMTYEA
jgi:hypothetical protein